MLDLAVLAVVDREDGYGYDVLRRRADDHGWGRKRDAWTSDSPPFLPDHPMVAVPPVALPSAGSEEQTGADDDAAAEDKPERDRPRR